ncbi:MAG: hypothetical protein ACRCUP_04550 [Mycoplasmatales bacterium]
MKVIVFDSRRLKMLSTDQDLQDHIQKIIDENGELMNVTCAGESPYYLYTFFFKD